MRSAVVLCLCRKLVCFPPHELGENLFCTSTNLRTLDIAADHLYQATGTFGLIATSRPKHLLRAACGHLKSFAAVDLACRQRSDQPRRPPAMLVQAVDHAFNERPIPLDLACQRDELRADHRSRGKRLAESLAPVCVREGLGQTHAREPVASDGGEQAVFVQTGREESDI